MSGLKAIDLALPGVKLITPKRFSDERGFFSEVYSRRESAVVGLDDEFVQDNHSLSVATNTVRGLHFQIPPHAAAKLVRVIRGRVFDVVVDVRHGTSTFGEHIAVELSADNWKQLYVPAGFAHGFCTLEPNTEVTYKVTDHWFPEVDKGVLWNDPDLGIGWPVSPESAVVSDKDRVQPRLSELPEYFVQNWVR